MGSSYSTTVEDVNTFLQKNPVLNSGDPAVYYPRHSADAVESFNILRQKLPSELVLEILELAQYWVLSKVHRDVRKSYDEISSRDRAPYLTSDPIRGERFPVRQIRINIWSHDQGWSDYTEDHGTFRNSWTWFELGIERPSCRDDICKEQDLRLATNVHARREATHHKITYQRDQDMQWLNKLQAGDRISIIPMARYPGWRNTVVKASIEIYTAPDL
ncbi:hypothetical protein N7475_003349 [Penicillium sp. IBT 31633x]|nr:hypothetical protein N7475_003349 [Penicillium sp. IBT 31633x]